MAKLHRSKNGVLAAQPTAIAIVTAMIAAAAAIVAAAPLVVKLEHKPSTALTIAIATPQSRPVLP